MGAMATGLSASEYDAGLLVPPLPDWVEAARLPRRTLLSDTDLTAAEATGLLDAAMWLKERRQLSKPTPYLAGKTLGMIFQHPSTRTRNAFQAGMEQLGGHATFLGTNELQLTRGETLADTAAIMSRYVDAIAARFAVHEQLVEFARGASVPVYNALTEVYHPIEALSDLLTLRERFGNLRQVTLAYIGDGNNVCHSLMLSSVALGVNVRVATPIPYQPRAAVIATAETLAAASGAKLTFTNDPEVAATGADAIYTDTHESMGEAHDPEKQDALAPFRVTGALMAAAKPEAVFMHCLPVHRGQEVEAAVVDGPRSVIFDQAENRLHMHKALLLLTLR